MTAYLIPENLASSSRVPEATRNVAAALRDGLADDVIVYLDPQDLELIDSESPIRLTLIHPRAGVLVIEAPGRAKLGLRARRGISVGKPKPISLQEFVQSASSITKQLQAAVDKLAGSSIIPCAATIADANVHSNDALKCGVPQGEIGGYLFSDDLEHDSINAAITRVMTREPTAPLTSQQEQAVRAIVRPNIVIKSHAKSDDGMFDTGEAMQSLRTLDLAQERLAHHIGDGYRVIRGVAGSGKTLVLLYRARYLAEHFPNRRYMIACFNSPLATALAAEVASTKNVEVRTIDSLVYKVNGVFDVKQDIAVQRKTAATKLAKLPPTGKFDGVFVDEAQDLDPAGLDLAYASLAPGKTDFVVALDGAQNIYRKKARWNPEGANARGRTKWLRVAYRNTTQIAEFAWRFLSTSAFGLPIDEDDDDPTTMVPPECTTRSGVSVRVIACADARGEADWIIEDIAKAHANGAAWSDFVVLYGDKASQTQLYRAATEKGVPYFWVSMNSKTKKQVMSAGDVVRVATMQGLKGLEFSRVYVCGVNDLPDWDDSDLETKRKIVYVAMTRATDHLTLTVSGKGPIGDALLAVNNST